MMDGGDPVQKASQFTTGETNPITADVQHAVATVYQAVAHGHPKLSFLHDHGSGDQFPFAPPAHVLEVPVVIDPG